jgi:hypothetical protein
MKKILLITALITAVMSLSACRQADRVSHNVSQEADNFNVMRRLSVINLRTDKPVFELLGTFSVQGGGVSNELSIIVQTGPEEYKKHLFGFNDGVIYVVEDISGANVNPYHYEINFLPEMIVPFEIINSH